MVPWYQSNMRLVLYHSRWDPEHRFWRTSVGLREISTVYFPPKNAVDTQYVLDCTLRKERYSPRNLLHCHREWIICWLVGWFDWGWDSDSRSMTKEATYKVGEWRSILILVEDWEHGVRGASITSKYHHSNNFLWQLLFSMFSLP